MEEERFFKRVIQGMAMGVANVVPGVSGGTMALILGIYKRLIHSINTLPLGAPIRLLKGEDVREDWNRIDFRFLVPVAVGVILATVLFARVMEYLLETYPARSYSFFIGLILASLVIVYRRIEPIGPRQILLGMVGFFLAFFVVGGQGIEGTHTTLAIFVAGILSIASMIIPGISGSLVLVLIGEYDFMVDALTSMDLKIMFIFVVGGLVGLFGLARVLEYFLKRHTSMTMAFLLGLVFGGLRMPFRNAMADGAHFSYVVIPAMVGAFLLLAMEYYRTRVTSD